MEPWRMYPGRIVGDRRLPVAAGLFYEDRPEALRAQLEWAKGHPLGPGEGGLGEPGGRVVGIVAPHGSLYYSGPIVLHAVLVAAPVKPGLVVVVGPNHSGLGARVSVYPRGFWSTPVGDVEVDEGASRLLAERGGFELDYQGHVYEHSVEVLLPVLLHVLGGGWRLVAVSLYDHSPGTASRLSEALAELASSRDDVLVVFSANLSGFGEPDEVRRWDELLLSRLLKGDAEGLYRVVEEEGIPTCSLGVLASAVLYASKLSASMRLLKHALSSDVAGGGTAVGYAAISLAKTSG